MRGRGRRRRQGDAGNGGEPFGEDPEAEVVAAEVVTPLRDAVRLVDREERDVRTLEQLHRPRQHEALGGEVEELELAVEEAAFDVLGLVEVEGRVEVGGADAEVLQCCDLIGHERDERGDDDTGALPHEAGDLIAQRLAATGGHEDDGVPAGDEAVDDPRLLSAELLVAEDIVEDVEGGGGGCGGHADQPSRGD